jgi:hypothetical protein
MTSGELAQALEASPLRHAHSAASALRSGWQIEVTESPGPFAELAASYSLRLQHLRKSVSAHAVQLAASVEELLNNLRDEAQSTGTWLTVSGPAEHEFLILFSATGRPLGCMSTVSQLQVTEERWSELWSEA